MTEPFLQPEDSFASLEGPEDSPFALDEFMSEEEAVAMLAEMSSAVDPMDPLSSVDLGELEGEIEQMLAAYDIAMKERREREELIEKCYNLRPVTEWTGQYEGASELISEIMMSTIDQAHARVSKTLFSARPFVNVRGVESEMEVPGAAMMPEGTPGIEGGQPIDAANIAERLGLFLDDYVRRTMRGEEKIDGAAFGTLKFGASVFKLDWDGKRARWTYLHNRDVLIWPSWADNWDDAEWAGHRTILTKSGLRRMAREFEGFLPGFLEKVEASVQSDGEGGAGDTFAELENVGIKADQVTSVEPFGIFELWDLWCDTILPGLEEPVKARVIYHPQSQSIGAIRYNERRSQRHPYYPLRMKRVPGTAWPQGLGHAALMMQMADTAFWNLGMDVMLSAAFGVHIMKDGSIMHQLFDRPTPGQRVATDDPAGDYRFESLADAEPLKMLEILSQDIQRRKVDATGQSAVLSGQGDPTMKSGAGTGSTMALIQEAATKFEKADAVFRSDVATLVLATLDLVAENEPGEHLFVYTPVEDTQILQQGFIQLASVPPGERIEDYLQITIEAPSAANNKELLRTNLMVIYEMVQQYVQFLTAAIAQPAYQAVNPAGMIEYLLKWAKFLDALTQRIIDAHEIPNLKGKLPKVDLGVDNPYEAMANNLMGQVQELQMQLQSLMAAAPKPNQGRTGAGPGQSEGSSS